LATVQRRFDSIALRASVGRGDYPVGVTRRPCSRWPIRVFTMAISLFMNAIPAFTMPRSGCSRCADPRVHDRA